MKDFANASFSPDKIEILKEAIDAAIATLPEPVSLSNVQLIAESILRHAKNGELDPPTLGRMALLELQITPHA